MKIRELEIRDAELMLEWMHDPRVNRFFRFDADKMTREDAVHFILSAREARLRRESFHFAIADDMDEYLGTISLKNVDWQEGKAEYAISLRTAAQGRGIGTRATEILLDYAFRDLMLKRVFLNVFSDNGHAIRMYEKCGFAFVETETEPVLVRGAEKYLSWYQITNESNGLQ